MKLPADVKVLLKLAPGAMLPEFQAPPSPVDVCVVLSLFVHVTVPPTATLIGLGENAVVVSVDEPLTIETGVPPPAGAGDGDGEGEGDGVGEGVDGESVEPQPITKAVKSVTKKIRYEDMYEFLPQGRSRRNRKLAAECSAQSNPRQSRKNEISCRARVYEEPRVFSEGVNSSAGHDSELGIRDWGFGIQNWGSGIQGWGFGVRDSYCANLESRDVHEH